MNAEIVLRGLVALLGGADEPGLVLHPLGSARLACAPNKTVAGSMPRMAGTKIILGFSIGPSVAVPQRVLYPHLNTCEQS